MPQVRFYAGSIDSPVNLTGSPAQIQDDPDAPDNDWIISTDPAVACAFTITFDISAAPPEAITAGSNWRLAMFVRNSRDTGQSADWGGAIHINGGTQTFTRVAVPDTANPTAGGIKQEQITALTGGVPLSSLSMDFDVTRSGGGGSTRTSLDWDSIEVILNFDDPPVFVDLTANGVGLAVGMGTMDIVPEELGTAAGAGVAVGTATAQLVPPTELAADGAGFGTGTATADLVPPTDLAAAGNGVGTGIGDMDQLPYDFAPAAGTGVGNGNGIIQPGATPINVELNITQPAPGNVLGLVTIQAVETDPSILAVRVLINPAHEDDPFGYIPDRIDQPDGTHEYDWSSTPYILTQQEIEATALFMGLRTGEGPSGFQVTGAFGSETLALNAPVLVDVLDGSAPELGGDGNGVGTGTATLTLVPVTELDTATGSGVGTGVAGTIDLDLTTAAGAGTGEGLATLSILLGFVASEALGVGTGEGDLDVVLATSEASGSGVGTGQASILVIRDLGFAQGFGQGSGGADSIDVLLDMPADGVGVGVGTATLTLVEGILWQDPATGVDDDPWDAALWEAFVQTPASVSATATIQSNTNEMTNDPNPPAIDLPGGAGDYIRSANQNVVTGTGDAAEAIHVNLTSDPGEGVGALWGSLASTVLLWVVDAATPGPAGGYFRSTRTATGSGGNHDVGASNRRFQLVPGDYTLYEWHRPSSLATDTPRINILFHPDNTQVNAGSSSGFVTFGPNAVDVWELLVLEFTVPVGGEFIEFRHQLNTNVANEFSDWGPLCVKAGHNLDPATVIPARYDSTVTFNVTAPVATGAFAGGEVRIGAGQVDVVNETHTVEVLIGTEVIAELSVSGLIDGALDPFGQLWDFAGLAAQVDNGGAYHEAIHDVFGSIRLDVDLISAITDPVVTSRQAVYISASGAPDINGVPANGLRVVIENPATGNIEARVEKVINHVITPLSVEDLTGYQLPFFISLARSGVSWGVIFNDNVLASFQDSGSDLELQDIPDGVTWVNTYNFGQADFRWDNFILNLLPFVEMQARGDGVGTGTAGLVPEFLDMNARSFGVGTGEGTLDSGIFFVSNAVGVGTGTGVLDLQTMTGVGSGVGTGQGFFSVDRELQGGGIGVGTGTGRLIFSTGNWVGGGVGVPGGASDADIAGGVSDAVPLGGVADATPKGTLTDADVDEGTATVDIAGDQASVEGP